MRIPSDISGPDNELVRQLLAHELRIASDPEVQRLRREVRAESKRKYWPWAAAGVLLSAAAWGGMVWLAGTFMDGQATVIALASVVFVATTCTILAPFFRR